MMRLGAGGGDDFEVEALRLIRSIYCGLVVAVVGIAIILGIIVGAAGVVML